MPSGKKITQATWDSHREDLRMLYLEEGMNLDAIRAEMNTNYGFCASKSQYETTFKKWNFRKNLSSSDWKFVGHRTKKRKVDDKESEVYLNGILIPSKRVKKELDRHFTPPYVQLYTTAPSPKTPQGIDIRTPENPTFCEIRLENLPWFQFQEVFEPHGDFNQDSIARMFDAREHRVRTPLVDPPASTWPALGFLAQGDPDQLVNEINDFDQNPAVWTPLVDPPALTWPALGFSAQRDPNQLESRANIARPVTSSIFDRLIRSSIDPGSVEYVLTVHSFMQDISLERNPGDFQSSIQKLHGPSNRDALTEFLKFAAYLSSNNMLSDCQSDRFLRWIIETNNYSTLGRFFSVKALTIEAFARCIFESALRIEDAAALRILLRAGVDPGPPTRMEGMTPLQVVAQGRNMELARILLDERVDVNALSSSGWETALGCAVKTADVEMVKMLLDAGADVNKGFRVSALELACSYQYVDVQIVQILLGAGADVEVPTYTNYATNALQAATQRGNVELVRLLLGAGADVNAPFLCSRSLPPGTVLQMVATSGEFKLSIKLARLLLDVGADVNAQAGYFDKMTALDAAANYGSVELVRMLLDAGTEANPQSDCGGYGKTALHLAAETGNVSIVLMLLNAGADVNTSTPRWDGDINRMAALQAAAKRGSVEIVRMLLDAGAEANVEANDDDDDDYDDNYGKALQIAAETGNVSIVRMLLKEGADVNAPPLQLDAGTYGMTALQAAVSSESPELVQMLLDAGADVNAPGRWYPYVSGPQFALERAAKAGSVKLVQMLLDAGADANAPSCFPLLFVARVKQHNIALVRILIAAGANVNAIDNRNRTALEVAIRDGHIVLIRVLVEAGADFNVLWPFGRRSFLQEAVVTNNVGLVQRLLYAGANIDVIHNPSVAPLIRYALHIAVEMNDIEMVQLLIGTGVDFNASASLPKLLQREFKCETRRTLVSAVWRRSVELVKTLLNVGENVNVTDGGWTALQAAAYNGDTELVGILLSAGADINAPACNDSGRTALQAAVIEGHTKLARCLLEKGADVNAPTAESMGVTALQGAAINGQLGVALMLIQAGAEPNAPPAKLDGRTALEGAAEHGRLDMVQLLLNAGADIDGRDRATKLAEKNGHVIIAEFLKGY